MLTPYALKNSRPQSRAYKLADGRGLYLLVKPNGATRHVSN